MTMFLAMRFYVAVNLPKDMRNVLLSMKTELRYDGETIFLFIKLNTNINTSVKIYRSIDIYEKAILFFSCFMCLRYY